MTAPEEQAVREAFEKAFGGNINRTHAEQIALWTKRCDALTKERDQLLAALERARWDIRACGILTSRTKVDEGGVDELLFYANQVEQHQIPAIKRIDDLLSGLLPTPPEKKGA